MRVQRQSPRVNLDIIGLYAARECTGGVVGEQYVESGNPYSSYPTFGRIAGWSEADHAAEMTT